MTIEFELPDIGEGLSEAEIVRWLVSEGDEVARNQPFVEIMTDKSNVEMPAPGAGVVARLVPSEGDMVQVGDLLIVIEERGGVGGGGNPDADGDPEPAGSETFGQGHDQTTATGQPPAGAVPPPSTRRQGQRRQPRATPGPGRRPKASPSTRRLAAELGIDLASVPGNGPGGRILAQDVRTTADGAAADPATTPSAAVPQDARPMPTAAPASGLGWMATGVHPLRGIRRATAKAMDRSWSTIPHISASQEIDATPLLDARRQLREAQGRGSRGAATADHPPITPLALVVLATAKALRRYPMMNATIDLEGETITVPDRVNIGIAVATEHGLVVPVVADADRLGIEAIAAEIQRLSSAARDRTIRTEDLAGGTHTITNYGSAGGHLAAPIIRPGESAITGLGGIADRPIVIEGEVVARPTLPIVVCSDHRLIDGDVMSAFHLDLCRTLSAPIGLLL